MEAFPNMVSKSGFFLAMQQRAEERLNEAKEARLAFKRSFSYLKFWAKVGGWIAMNIRPVIVIFLIFMLVSTVVCMGSAYGPMAIMDVGATGCLLYNSGAIVLETAINIPLQIARVIAMGTMNITNAFVDGVLGPIVETINKIPGASLTVPLPFEYYVQPNAPVSLSFLEPDYPAVRAAAEQGRYLKAFKEAFHFFTISATGAHVRTNSLISEIGIGLDVKFLGGSGSYMKEFENITKLPVEEENGMKKAGNIYDTVLKASELSNEYGNWMKKMAGEQFVVWFTASNPHPKADEKITFYDNTYIARRPLKTEYFWDFGDDSTSTEKNPTHTYNAPDTYEVMHVVKITVIYHPYTNISILGWRLPIQPLAFIRQATEFETTMTAVIEVTT